MSILVNEGKKQAAQKVAQGTLNASVASLGSRG